MARAPSRELVALLEGTDEGMVGLEGLEGALCRTQRCQGPGLVRPRRGVGGAPGAPVAPGAGGGGRGGAANATTECGECGGARPRCDVEKMKRLQVTILVTCEPRCFVHNAV